MDLDTLFLYFVVSFFYVISPGPAVFLAMANGMSTNMKVVALSSLGNILGLFFLSTISIVGLGSLILASATLFMVVKVVGAVYLLYLGIRQFRSSKSIRDSDIQSFVSEGRSRRSYFFEGFFLAATNPKPILFFIAIFPQFLNIEAALMPQFLIMTSVFMAISFMSLFSYGFVARSARSLFANKQGMKWFHRVTGSLFVGMGFGLLQLKNAPG